MPGIQEGGGVWGVTKGGGKRRDDGAKLEARKHMHMHFNPQLLLLLYKSDREDGRGRKKM